MKLSTRLVSIGAALVVSLPAMAFELVNSNETVKLPAAPGKIVSFDLAALDTLNTLGVPVIGVPKSTYAGSLSKFNEATVVGTLFEPDYDVLKKIQPDLIIAGGRSQKAVPELQKVAPTATFDSDPS